MMMLFRISAQLNVGPLINCQRSVQLPARLNNYQRPNNYRRIQFDCFDRPACSQCALRNKKG